MRKKALGSAHEEEVLSRKPFGLGFRGGAISMSIIYCTTISEERIAAIVGWGADIDDLRDTT